MFRESKQSLQVFHCCDERMVPFLLWWMVCKAMLWDAVSWVTEMLSHKWKTCNSHSVTAWCGHLGKKNPGTSSLWLLQSKLFTERAVRLPWQAYRLLPRDWQMLGNPFAWFNESVGEKMVCNLGKRWKREWRKRVKCQKGTSRTLHLYEMGVISLPEVITIAPLMEMPNYWKQLINCKSSRVSRSSYLNHLLCLTQLSCSSSSITFYKKISKTCLRYRPSHVGQPRWVIQCFEFSLANKTCISEVSLLILQDDQARHTCSCSFHSYICRWTEFEITA